MGVDPSHVGPATSLGDLGCDELDFVELVIEIEDRFSISIPDETAEKMLGTEDWQVGLSNVTMQKLADAVDAQQNGTSDTGPVDSAVVRTIGESEGAGPPLTDATVRRLNILFSPEVRKEAIRLLEDECGNNLPFLGESTAEELERYRFAALKISNGRLEDLQKAVELAKTDWRDLLMSAGFGEDPTAHSRWLPDTARPADSVPGQE
jgi:acyl carrier protein